MGPVEPEPAKNFNIQVRLMEIGHRDLQMNFENP
jgi:hypothetical protein